MILHLLNCWSQSGTLIGVCAHTHPCIFATERKRSRPDLIIGYCRVFIEDLFSLFPVKPFLVTMGLAPQQRRRGSLTRRRVERVENLFFLSSFSSFNCCCCVRVAYCTLSSSTTIFLPGDTFSLRTVHHQHLAADTIQFFTYRKKLLSSTCIITSYLFQGSPGNYFRLGEL